MLNRIQSADSLNAPIPAGGCTSGALGLIGNDLVGIYANTYPASYTGDDNYVTLHLEGAYRNLPLKTGDTPVQGDKLYFDSVNNYLTTTNTYPFAGWAWEAPYTIGTVYCVSLKLKYS